MAVRVFILKNVAEDEAEDIRALLTENEIAFYETPEKIWGISVPAIWLQDDAQLPAARELIERYERQRAATEQEKYRDLRKRGQARTVADLVREHPLRYIAYCLAIIVVLYFSTKPFLSL